jgi:hypothetical protein
MNGFGLRTVIQVTVNDMSYYRRHCMNLYSHSAKESYNSIHLSILLVRTSDRRILQGREISSVCHRHYLTAFLALGLGKADKSLLNLVITFPEVYFIIKRRLGPNTKVKVNGYQ